MACYNVLLVDDEKEVCQVIIRKLDWESMGFHIVGYAANGVEALEMAEELQPDVVMTDIKMPYMDGLTLSKKLKEAYQKIKIIIFSGFDEFEYAKEAIKVEATEYILKPINESELREVFERVKTDLDRELDERRNIDKLRQYYLESLPVLQENFYITLLEGRLSQEQIEETLKNYQIQWAESSCIVTILHISSKNLPAQMDSFLAAISVKRLAEEQLQKKWDSKIFVYLGDVILITSMSEEKNAIAGYTDTMDRFCKLAKRVCGVTVTAGIGYICDTMKELSSSYEGARHAVSYRVLYGSERAINIAEIDPYEEREESWGESGSIQKIIHEIKMGDREKLKQAVSEGVKHLAETSPSIMKYRVFVMTFITEVFRFGSKKINMEQVFEKQQDIYGHAMQMESPEELKNWILEIAERMQDMVLSERDDTVKSFVEQAVEYVHEHYGEQNLSVETICRSLGVSNAYFSTLFKKETGKTFINFLTDCRMEKAVELLLERDEKTYMVAEKVGYSDPNYFSYVFKRKFGVSPSKYKTGKREQA